MATNLNLDDALLDAARTAGGHRTKREAANTALRQYVEQQLVAKRIAACTEAFADLAGTFDFDPAYDHREARRHVRGGA